MMSQDIWKMYNIRIAEGKETHITCTRGGQLALI